MITVPQIVEELIKQTPLVEESLTSGLINVSSLARQIRPRVQQQLDQKSLRDRPVQLSAIIMSLNRLKVRLAKKSSQILPILKKITDITVRSNLIQYTYTNSPTLVSLQIKLLELIDNEKGTFLNVTHGVLETSFFTHQALEEKIDLLFQKEKQLQKLNNLSSITILLPEEAVTVPGVYYSILKQLAWEGISFQEIVSSFTEVTFYIEADRVEAAFSALKKLSS